jgi:hypothetical protein
MRTFEKFPADKNCPICNTNRDAECWLMPVDYTDNGNICEAVAVHVDCTGKPMIGQMRYNREAGAVYCFVPID